jgi:hypothetical protein
MRQFEYEADPDQFRLLPEPTRFLVRGQNQNICTAGALSVSMNGDAPRRI